MVSKTLLFFVYSQMVTLGVGEFNFLVVGDWGGVASPPYTTPGQKASAKGMDRVATSLNSQFVVALGDNFYSEGVTDENSIRFEKTFESIYTADSLQTPWYVIAGNHDYKGNVSAQIAHSNLSTRWKFPSEFHSHSFVGDDGVTLDLILIDTPTLASSSDLVEGELGYFNPLPEVPRSFAESQWTWIEDRLKASTADFVVLGGHYPVYSVCQHGNTETLVTNLRPLLEKYGAHYMAGHDHCMEHFVEPGSLVNHFLSGMGDTCCYRSENKDKVPKDSLQWYIALDNMDKSLAGFTSFSLTRQAMTATFYNEDGKVLYTTPAILPRVKA